MRRKNCQGLWVYDSHDIIWDRKVSRGVSERLGYKEVYKFLKIPMITQQHREPYGLDVTFQAFLSTVQTTAPNLYKSPPKPGARAQHLPTFC